VLYYRLSYIIYYLANGWKVGSKEDRVKMQEAEVSIRRREKGGREGNGREEHTTNDDV